ncbi:nucleotide exchange factor GrpE [Rhizobium multihospitium]|uniref:Protein GrpE n=1 Tax=Rhizobium multihospitium TaxID=410764 RepID=A0A1C3VZS5_9HYPH|nr:nucleotide exchange factor GrpE [Rhizobium multihospitium]SCB33262.1 molecular chaperone GrpE [Rhizobium multihospitium]
MSNEKRQPHEKSTKAVEGLHPPIEPVEGNNSQEAVAIDERPSEMALSEKLKSLEADNKSLQDRLLRALAETENVRRRAERDVSDARQYAVTQFAGDMTRVADNLARAISSIPEEIRRDKGPVRTLIEGVELTEKELLRTLEKHGVTKLDPAGEAFDPNFHEAMFETEDPSVPRGTVTMVVEPGYAIGTRPLRPAKVAVSRGGPPRSSQS